MFSRLWHIAASPVRIARDQIVLPARSMATSPVTSEKSGSSTSSGPSAHIRSLDAAR